MNKNNKSENKGLEQVIVRVELIKVKKKEVKLCRS